MLETSRAAHKEDKDSLVVQTQGGPLVVVVDCILISSSHPPGHVTILRHLLSADSRNERLTWCDILNKALENLRAWDIVTPRWVELVTNIIILLFHDFNMFYVRSGSISSFDSVDTVSQSSASTEIW